MLCWKFAKFLKSFLKAQVSFPSICSSKFISIKHNSSILFLTQTIYTLVKISLLNANVWDFGVLGLKLVKFLMSILNWQVSFSSNFVSLFFAMTQNSSVNPKLIHFLLWIRRSHQSPNYFWFSDVICWKFAKFLKSFLKAQVSFPSIVSSKFISIKHNSSILFLTQTLYTLVKSSLLKCKFLRFWSARVKFVKSSCKFWTDKSISLQIWVWDRTGKLGYFDPVLKSKIIFVLNIQSGKLKHLMANLIWWLF